MANSARYGADAVPIVVAAVDEEGAVDWKLELVAIPVSDVDRAKSFYTDKVGFAADHDHRVSEDMRFVQLTPPGSACSIAIGRGHRDARLRARCRACSSWCPTSPPPTTSWRGGASAVSEVQEFPWGSFVFFSDPDGNGWAVQQLPARA